MIYFALLRGINISGKNKISMDELKKALVHAGFENVKSYLNSGNIIFSDNNSDIQTLEVLFEKIIKESFGLDIPVFILSYEMVVDALENTPPWWGLGDKGIYDNLIFVKEKTAQQIIEMIGPCSEGLEKVHVYKNVIFHSFDRVKYQKCNYWKKTAQKGIGEYLTIRTASTIQKLVELAFANLVIFAWLKWAVPTLVSYHILI